MFYALSENESYFADKVSLYVALAPITKITNEESTAIRWASMNYDLLDHTIKTLGMYEMLGSNWLVDTVTREFCTILEEFCNLLQKLFDNKHPDTDDPDRFAVYMGHSPNGTPAQSLMLYAQNMREDRYQVYAPDYDHWFNIGEHHHTDLIPLENIKEVPVAMFVGDSDILGDAVDAEYTKEAIGDAVIHYSLIHGGHLTFLVGKDMTYWTTDVMNLLAQYHPISDKHHPQIPALPLFSFLH